MIAVEAMSNPIIGYAIMALAFAAFAGVVWMIVASQALSPEVRDCLRQVGELRRQHPHVVSKGESAREIRGCGG